MLAMLATQIQESSKRVIIRFTAEEPAAIVEGVNAFDKAGLQFAMERILHPEDTPEMKSALAMVTWKNNELVETVPSFPSVEIIDAAPSNMHNVPQEKIFRPSAWAAFGMDPEGADYRACQNYGPVYK